MSRRFNVDIREDKLLYYKNLRRKARIKSNQILKNMNQMYI